MGCIKDGVYYDSRGNAAHRGVVEFDDKLYYAGQDGILVKDSVKTIHHGMSNGHLKHGTYYFDKDGVCDLKSYRRSRKHHSRIKNAIKKMGHKQKTALLISLVATAALIGLFVAGELLTKKPSSVSHTESGGSQQLKITLEEYNSDVYLCSNEMKQYYLGAYTLDEARKKNNKLYQPFDFVYSVKNAASASLLLSENVDYSDGTVYDLDVNKTSITINNLKTNVEYYYAVTASDSSGTELTKKGSFKTADTNRFIYLDGVYNTRDIGGYDTIYGKRIKQGLLIRGTELDGLVEHSYYMTDPTQAEPFGFVYDFDLRNREVTTVEYVSRLGSDTIHKFYDSPMYGTIFAKEYKENLKQIFTDLADPDNYPMYLHCTYGTDRTGTVVFLLQGLLGVSEEDMMTEYQLSGFFIKDYITGNNLQSTINGLQNIPGNTINERIENFMLDTVGITEEQIQQIREIYLGSDYESGLESNE